MYLGEVYYSTSIVYKKLKNIPLDYYTSVNINYICSLLIYLNQIITNL